MRNYKVDNIKAVLIFLVVLGHLLECFGGYKRLWLYYVIYLFHMPTFVYVTGYYAKQNSVRVVKHVLYPYAIYQLLYLLFQRFYLKEENLIQFSTPYWLLWYQFSLFIWMLLLQLIDEKAFSKRKILLMSILLSLIVGFDKSVGYTMSLSRTVVLLPFFILGHYRIFDNLISKNVTCILKMGITVIIVLSMYCTWVNINEIKSIWFYHSTSYEAGGYTIWIRLSILLISAVWCMFLFIMIPNKNIPCITKLGSHTLCIFLLHGFVVKWISTIQLFRGAEITNILLSLILAGAICISLGNKFIDKILYFTFRLD